MKEEKKQTKTVVPVIIGSIAAIIAIVAIIVAMVLGGGDSPKKALENRLKEVKKGDYAQEMILGSLQEGNDFNAETQKLLFEKLEWKILEEKIEGEEATVEVEITNKDFKTIISNYTQKVLKIALSGQGIAEEEMTNYLIEELENDEIETTTSKQSIVLRKQEGKWELADANEFANVVLPGLYEAISAFN